MVTIGKIEKRINKELTAIKKVAIKEVVKTTALIGMVLAGATAVVGILAKDENEGVTTENYRFDCSGLSATNDGRAVIVTLEERSKLAEILKDYHWIDGTDSKGKIVIYNGKETIYYNDETGALVNFERKIKLTLSTVHNQEVKKFFED